VLPAEIMDFGNELLQEKVDDLIAIKLNSISEPTYYIGKMMWKKLFNRELSFKR
jgi:hypothetical protein